MELISLIPFDVEPTLLLVSMYDLVQNMMVLHLTNVHGLAAKTYFRSKFKCICTIKMDMNATKSVILVGLPFWLQRTCL